MILTTCWAHFGNGEFDYLENELKFMKIVELHNTNWKWTSLNIYKPTALWGQENGHF